LKESYLKEEDQKFKEKYIKSAFDFLKSASIELNGRIGEIDQIFIQLNSFTLKDSKSFDHLRSLGKRFEKTSLLDDITEFFTEVSIIESNLEPIRIIVNDKNGDLISNWMSLIDQFPSNI